MTGKGLTISELARAGDVGVETVRYYQRRGLIADPRPGSRGGAAGGIRHYGADDLKRLNFIRSAQRAGFQLAEVARLLELDAVGDRARARAMARERIARLDAEIAAMTAARARLEKLARDCAGGGQGPCPIIEAFAGD